MAPKQCQVNIYVSAVNCIATCSLQEHLGNEIKKGNPVGSLSRFFSPSDWPT